MAEALKIRIEVDGSQLQVFDQAGKKLAEVGLAADKAAVATQEHAAATDSAAASWSRGQVAVVSLAAGLVALAAAMAAMNAAWNAATAGIERGGFFDDLSKKLNVSVESLTSMTLALNASGVSFETYGRALNILSRNVFDFQRGIGEAKDAFEALGLSAADFAGKSPEQAFALVTERLQGMRDPLEQNAVAMKVLGRSAAELGPLIKTPAAEIERFRVLTEKLGLTLTTETAAALDAVGDNLGILGQVSVGITQQFAVGMEPALRAITDDLVNLAAELVNGGGGFRALGADIGAWLQGPAQQAIDWIREFAARIKEEGLGPAIAEAFEEARSAAGTGAAALGSAMGVALVNAVKSEIRSGFASFQWADYIPRFDPASWITGATSGAIRQIGDDFRAAFAGTGQSVDLLGESFANASRAADPLTEAIARVRQESEQSAATHAAQAAAVDAAAASTGKSGAVFVDTAQKALVYKEAIGATADGTIIYRDVVDKLAFANLEYEENQKKATKATEDGGKAAAGAKSAVDALRESLDKQIATLNQSNAELLRKAEVYEQAAREGLTLEQAERRVAEAMIQVQAAALGASGATDQQVAAFVRARTEALQLGDRVEEARERLVEMGEDGEDAAKKVEQSFLGLGTVGDSLKDSFSEVFDAIVAGTLDLGDVFKNLGIAVGKNLFEQVLDEKFKFDTIFEGNILDLAGNVLDVLGGAFGSVFGDAGGWVAELFGGGGGSGGSGSSGSGIGGTILKGIGGKVVDWIGDWFTGGNGGGILDGLFSSGSTAGSIIDATGGWTGVDGSIWGAIGQNADGTFIYGPISGPSSGGGLGGSLGALGSGLLVAGAGYLGNLGGGLINQGLYGGPRNLQSAVAQQTSGTVATLVATIVGGIVGSIVPGIGTLLGAAGGALGGGLLGQGFSGGSPFLNLNRSQYAGLSSSSATGLGILGGVGGVLGNIAFPAERILSKQLGIDGSILQMTNPIGPLVALDELILNAILGAIFRGPTVGTLHRESTEKRLGKTEAFGPFFKENMFDISKYRGSDFPGGQAELAGYQAALGPDALDAIRGFSAVVGPMSVDLDTNLSKVAAQAFGLANQLTDMFARMGLSSEEAAVAVKQTLGQAFSEMGITAPKAFEDISARIELFADTPWWEESVTGAEFIGDSLRGVASIFEAQLPAGIDLASLALQGFERDGVKAFNVVDSEGRDALRSITGDAEKFDELVQGLVERGFTLDTEGFEDRIADLSGSAALVGESLGSALTSGASTGSEAVERVLADLQGQVVQAVAGVSLQQLFDTTAIADSFESVFAALRRLQSGEFNLASGTGVAEFRAILEPALAEGRANLEAYIPIIEEQIKLWKEVDKAVAEALEPSELDKAFQRAQGVVSGFFGDFQTLVGNAIAGGIAVLAEGGSYVDALSVFNSALQTGAENALRSALFNAMVDTAVLAPLIDQFGPALQFIVTQGMVVGFDDPAVQDAWKKVLGDLGNSVGKVAPFIFDAYIDIVGVRDENGNIVDVPLVGPDAPTPTGDRRTFRGAATGGFFRDAAIVGEAGMPELVTFTGDGFNVTPLDWETARALMGHGMPGYAQGRPTLPGRGPGGGGTTPPRTGGGGGVGTRPGDGGGGGGGGGDDRSEGDEPEFADFTAAIVDAIRQAFDDGGDFVQDFGDNLYEITHQRLIDAVIEGFSERAGIQRLAENIDKQLERARNIIQSGLGGPDVIAGRLADVQRRIAANIELMRRQAEQLEPILDQLRLAQLEVDVSGDIGSTVADLISGALEAGDLEESLKRVFYAATIQGIVEALLITGPLADAMDEFSDAMGDAIREAMEDGVISEEEAQRIRDIADDWRDRVEPIIDGIGDAFDGLFDDSEDEARELLGRMRQGANFFGGELGQAIRRAWHSVTPEDVAAAIPILHQTLDQTIRDAVYQGLQGGVTNFEDLAKQIKIVLAKHVLDGLIEAFVQSAIIEGALGPLFAVIGAQFKALIDAIIAGAAADAETITRTILEAIGRIAEIFEDPNFQRIWNELFGPDGAMAEMIRNLGLSMEDIFGGVEQSVDRLTDATAAAEDVSRDVCKGTCNLMKQTATLGELQLDVGGRGGVATLERYVPRYPNGVPGGPGGGGGGGGGGGPVGYDPFTLAQAQRAFNDWLVIEFGSGGADRLTPEERIKQRPGFWADLPQYAGIPVLDRGADVMGPTLALLAANNRPERVQPLGSAGGMVESADMKALLKENREIKAELQSLKRELRSFARAIESRPAEFHGTAIVDGRTAGEIQFAGEKRNRQNRRSSLNQPRAGR